MARQPKTDADRNSEIKTPAEFRRYIGALSVSGVNDELFAKLAASALAELKRNWRAPRIW